ncbi:MAG: type II toxin-antitoxin system YafQ family toxin [Chloroflexota bacterium]|nr:type II toxin-antitoxin system YafQ family toxin [Chloroflexota bacterium]MDE2886550.1 type II toxin-antitoxin system YafQ family toxin [Chloroflexota bacterium]
MRLATTNGFKRDVRLVQRRGKDLAKLWTIVEQLLSGQPLEARNRPRRLSGEMDGFWECHIEPDWLLVWEQGLESLLLVRTGTHADLFE